MQNKKATTIIFTGPESSGKTTLSKSIADYYQVNWVKEYSRTYLENLQRPYQQTDLITIAKGQLEKEQTFIKNNPNNLFHFFDTSLLVIKVWSIFKYGSYNFELEKMLLQNLPDYYFLCDYHIPWEYDPMRENPNERAELYRLYKKELIALKVPFFEIKGTKMERKEKVISILENKKYALKK